MTDSCGCPPEDGSAVCELPSQTMARPSRAIKTCPQCHQSGKPVQRQTVKAMLSVSLREVQDGEYLFCKTKTCGVFVCYCFRHTVGKMRQALPAERTTIVDDINAGIQAEQCACDLRNPQGSCCLGNVRGVIKQQEKISALATN